METNLTETLLGWSSTFYSISDFCFIWKIKLATKSVWISGWL